MSLRCARSPEPPKMTIVEARGYARAEAPRAADSASRWPPALFLLHGVTAELIAERGGDLHRVAVFLPRHEAREERVGDGRHRHAVRDGLEHRPAAFARILDPTFDVLKVAALLLEGALGELEEPRPYDAPLEPDRGDLLQVELELTRVEQLEAFAVRLHHSALDPVVDHLHEMARAALSEMRPAVRRGEGVERGLRDRDRVGGTTDHHAVAVLEPPDPTRHPDVDEAEFERAVFVGAAHRIAEVAVAPIDEHVTGRGEARELVERVLRGIAGRHHRPEHARRLDLFDHVLDRARGDGAVRRRLLYRLGAAVAGDHAVTAAGQPGDHVPAHPSEPVQTYVHVRPPPETVRHNRRPVRRFTMTPKGPFDLARSSRVLRRLAESTLRSGRHRDGPFRSKVGVARPPSSSVRTHAGASSER